MNAFRFFTLSFTLFVLLLNFQIRAQGDDCQTSLLLSNVVKYCSGSQQYSNIGATASGWAIGTCWPANTTADVWFYFKAVGTDVQISVSGETGKGTIRRPNIELISGTCGGPSIACSSSGTTNIANLYKGGLIPGATYIIRVSTTNANTGTFTLCVNSYKPDLNPGADCDGAVRLCDKSPISVPGLSGPGKDSKEIETSSCFFGPNTPAGTSAESNSSWYWWTCETAGSLTFRITPNDAKNDIDFLIYELDKDDPCGKRTIIRCTATQCVLGANGLDSLSNDVSEPTTTVINGVPQNCDPQYNGFLKYLSMVAGKSYALVINNFSTSSGFSIDFGGTGTIKGPKAVISSGTSPFVCKGESVTYTGINSVFYDSLAWVFTGGTPSTAATVGPHKINYDIPGTYITYLKAMNKTCASGNSIDSVKITINAPPVIDASNPVVSNADCDKPTGSITGLIVTGTPTFTYEWYVPPATSVFTSTTSTDLTNMPPGSYYMIVTDGNGCMDTTENYEIKNFDTPDKPGVSNNIPYCAGVPMDPITATGNGGIYTWFGNKDLTDTLHIGPVYTPVNTVTDTLYLTETSHGCTSEVDTVIVVIIPLPDLSGVINNIPNCEGATIGPITADGNGGTYTWYDDKALTNIIHIGPVYTPTNTVTDTIYVTESAKGCTSDVDTVIVVINPLPTVDAGLTKHIVCSSPNDVELEGTATGGINLIYSWNPSSGLVSGGNTLTPVVKTEGTYTLTVKNEDTGCMKTDEVNVIKDPVPIAAFTPNVYKGEDPLEVIFTNTSKGSNTYLWILDGDNKSTDKNTSYVYTKPNEYTVLLISSDSSKCPDTARVRIIVYEKFTVAIPNVFTPNGDGFNDVFTVNTTGISELSGEIYDRWGLQLYSWSQKNGGWDGRSPAGSMSPAGTYYYILKIKPLDGGEPYIKAGELTLLR